MSITIHANLKDKVAVVTGGSGILCGAMAKELARHGAKVAVFGSRQETADKTASEITASGGKAIGVACNVLDIESIKNAREIVNKEFGLCDILINGAGGNHPDGVTTKETFSKSDLNDKKIKTFFDMTLKGFEHVFDLNFLGTFNACQVFGLDLAETKGTILNISSMSAPVPLTKVPAYSAAKAAIDNFTKWLAVHMADAGVRVNAIAPGFFLTEQNKTLLTTPEGGLTERAQKVINKTPMGRFGKPEELLGTMVWLLDNEMSAFVTGITVPVDGGFMAFSGV